MENGGLGLFNAMTAACGSTENAAGEQQDLLADAKRALDGFAFVGFTETFDQSVAQLQRQFGWASQPIGQLNAAPELPLSQNRVFLRWLESAVSLDEEFYDYALQRRVASARPTKLPLRPAPRREVRGARDRRP
jgi:hypothetical protein